MSHSHTSNSSISAGLAFGGILGLVLALAGSLWIAREAKPTVDVAARRGEYRLEIRKKLADEDSAKLSTLEWAKKDAGLVRVPVDVAIPLTLKELSQKQVGPSTVKVDAVVAAPSGDAPALPSSPSGAHTIRFSAPSAESNSEPAR